VWLFDEATGAIYQVCDGTALSSSSKLMIAATKKMIWNFCLQ
jgi:hypothetical protein